MTRVLLDRVIYRSATGSWADQLAYRIKDRPAAKGEAGRSLKRAGHGGWKRHIVCAGRGEVNSFSREEWAVHGSGMEAVAARVLRKGRRTRRKYDEVASISST